MKRAALLIVAFSGGKVEALTDGNVMRQQIAGNRFRGLSLPEILGNDVNDTRRVVHAHHKRLDRLERGQQHECCCAYQGAQPSAARGPPSDPLASATLGDAIRFPGGSLAPIRFKFDVRHGALAVSAAVAGSSRAAGSAITLIGRNLLSQLTGTALCAAQAASTSQLNIQVAFIESSSRAVERAGRLPEGQRVAGKKQRMQCQSVPKSRRGARSSSPHGSLLQSFAVLPHATVRRQWALPDA